MSKDERAARRLWFAALQGLLAAYYQAELDGRFERAADLGMAHRQMKEVGASIGWRPRDAAKEVLTDMAE